MSGAGTREGTLPPRHVVNLLDYFESGHRAAEEFVRRSDQTGATSDLAGTIRRCKQSCVLLDIQFDLGGDRREMTIGSGVLIDGGRRILTAGHCVKGPGEVRIRVRYPGGQTRRAYLRRSEYDRHGSPDEDWAVLEVPDSPKGVVSSPAWGAARKEGLAIVVGYPDEIGIDSAGRIAYALTEGDLQVEPLAMLAVINRENPMSLTPWAGAIPTRGMSGGPVFDADGHLIGLFVSVTTTHTNNVVNHTYDACAVSAVRGVAGTSGSQNPRTADRWPD